MVVLPYEEWPPYGWFPNDSVFLAVLTQWFVAEHGRTVQKRKRSKVHQQVKSCKWAHGNSSPSSPHAKRHAGCGAQILQSCCCNPQCPECPWARVHKIPYHLLSTPHPHCSNTEQQLPRVHGVHPHAKGPRIRNPSHRFFVREQWCVELWRQPAISTATVYPNIMRFEASLLVMKL